jgi:hypothetical protein
VYATQSLSFSMKFLGLLVLLFGVLSVSAFRGMPQRSFSGTQLTMNLQQNCKQITKALGVGALSFLVSGAPLNYIQSDGMVSLVQPAAADVRAQQKRTYFRFAPKFNEGKEYYKNEVKAAIDKDDFTVVSKLFENFVTKVNRNTDQETTDTYANVHYTRPMTLLGGTFAERGTSAKTRALQEQEALFITAMQKLEGTMSAMNRKLPTSPRSLNLLHRYY